MAPPLVALFPLKVEFRTVMREVKFLLIENRKIRRFSLCCLRRLFPNKYATVSQADCQITPDKIL
jgi:hypothetical protein